jgi:hypothetical protein
VKNLSLKNVLTSSIDLLKRAVKPEVLAFSVVAVVVVAVTINTSFVIMQNYKLERSVRVLEQRVAVADIELETTKAQNDYYATDEYLDIAARKLLSKGVAGEKMIIIPREVALKEVPAEFRDQSRFSQDPAVLRRTESNYEKWLRFLRGDLAD